MSVASKYGSDMTNTARTITKAVVDKFEEFKEQLDTSLPSHVRSVVLQVNDEISGKKLMPINRYINLPSASANAAQPLFSLNKMAVTMLAVWSIVYFLMLLLLLFRLRFHKIMATITEASDLILICSSLFIRR